MEALEWRKKKSISWCWKFGPASSTIVLGRRVVLLQRKRQVIMKRRYVSDYTVSHPQKIAILILADLRTSKPVRLQFVGTFKQDRQCTYNVKQRRVRVTIVAVEKQKVLDILNGCLLS